MRELTPDVVDRILKNTLPELVRELSASAWYVSEHAVINLFVFGHLVPALQKLPEFLVNGWDLTLIGMEASVPQAKKEKPARPSTRKDLVFWRQPRSTRWRGCDLSQCGNADYIREHSCRPLAVVEWKNIKLGEQRDIQAEYDANVEWFRNNLRLDMLDVGYATLIDQSKQGTARLSCHRLTKNGENARFIVLP
jgi:hypothetical protein